MKRYLFILIFCITLYACKNDNTKNTSVQHDAGIQAQKEHPKKLSVHKHQTLKNWVKYYQSIDSSFKLQKFDSINTNTLKITPGSVQGKFERNFDSIYTNFLIYSPHKKKYLDIDSYHWVRKGNSEKEFLYRPDQEINLVNLSNETVERIAFRGPSFTIEDAYWVNENTVILLEGSADKVPAIYTVDLKNKKITKAIYRDTLQKESNYYKQRIKTLLNAQ